MSDEPLYCEACGKEWIAGPDGCCCDFAPDDDPPPPREKRYCHVCGIIPAIGKACHFYERGGNPRGCVDMHARGDG